jgi:predicted nucleic acid-binding protein
LADRHWLTVYDAAYLELALRPTLPLATLDDELREAAQRASACGTVPPSRSIRLRAILVS